MRLASPVPKKRARIEIIPLIDIMFFLLASFMMVSLSQTHMKGIRVNLPAAIGPPPSGVKDFVSVKVLEGNAVFFDNVYVSEDQVLPRLFELHRGNPRARSTIVPSTIPSNVPSSSPCCASAITQRKRADLLVSSAPVRASSSSNLSTFCLSVAFLPA